ncbi:MAG: tRNA lysidine(34) synthetase TilS [Lachnospiraceae bacterium]|nr:tRNA lysidine(34) synthetase TilS [Lachnospiraceae bacterium]
MELKEQVGAYIEAQGLIRPEDTVLIGVSGGADSLCLFHLLRELHGHILVCHVHHHLRENADADAEAVRALCEEWGVAFRRADVDVEALVEREGLSCEEAARILRYEALRSCLAAEEPDPGKRRLAVAHTIEDDAETVLHNLFRGSGLKGLGGIRPRQQLEDCVLIRPLLEVSRAQIESYLKERGISWCCDESNEGDDYARNRIRHHILPEAQRQVNARAALHVHAAAEQLSAAEDFIEELLKGAYGACCEEIADGLRMRRDVFCGLHPYLRQRLALLCMQKVSGSAKDISAVHVRLLSELFGMPRGKMLDLPHRLHALRTGECVELVRKA